LYCLTSTLRALGLVAASLLVLSLSKGAFAAINDIVMAYLGLKSAGAESGDGEGEVEDSEEAELELEESLEEFMQEAPLAGAAGADAPAIAGVGLALLAGEGVAAPPGAESLLPHAASNMTDRPKHRPAFRNEFERVFFIFSECKSLSKVRD
jgi:hypothetical protein